MHLVRVFRACHGVKRDYSVSSYSELIYSLLRLYCIEISRFVTYQAMRLLYFSVNIINGGFKNFVNRLQNGPEVLLLFMYFATVKKYSSLCFI